MNRKVIVLGVALGLLFFVGVAGAAPVNTVSYASLTGTELITFEDLSQIAAPGTNYDGIVVSGGVAFAERFVGQTLSTSGGFDQLSGSPSDSLALQVGAAGQNINIFAGDYGGKYGNVLDGLGPVGFPDFGAIGEGAFSLLFSTDQSEFGFSIIGGDGGNAFLNFYRRDGSLVDAITLGDLGDLFYGFSRDGGIKDIAGISIYNSDGGGIGVDDIKHDVQSNISSVPEPGSLLFLGSGLLGLVGYRRTRRMM